MIISHCHDVSGTGNVEGLFNWRSKVCYDELGCFSKRSYCNENLRSLLPEPPEQLDTRFLLYTNLAFEQITYDMTRNDFQNLGFDSTRETKVFIHGFIDSVNGREVAVVRDALIAKV